MRMARAADYWRHVTENAYPQRVDRLVYDNVLGLGQGDVRFRAGITVVCGTNGVGKSSLLDCLWGALATTDLSECPTASLRLSGASVVAQVNKAGALSEHKASWKAGAVDSHVSPFPLNVIRIDPSRESLRLSTEFREMSNVSELLAAIEPHDASDSDLKVLSEIIGRNYTSWKTYEVETQPDVIRPYFCAECDGYGYGVETMGDGEIAIMYAIWSVARAEKMSVILVEEPECLIPPRSQTALMNFFAQCSDEKKLWMIVTTHAPGILAAIPHEHICRLIRVDGNVIAMCTSAAWEPLADLGIEPQKRLIVLTEDRFAKVFAKLWVQDMDFVFSRQCHVTSVAGKDGIRDALQHFPDTGGAVSVVGLFDGDVKKENISLKQPFAFLPSNLAPEVLVLDGIQGDIAALARLTGIDEQHIRASLARMEGKDHHDWVEEFAKEIDRPYESVVHALYRRWVNAGENRAEAKRSFDELLQVTNT